MHNEILKHLFPDESNSILGEEELLSYNNEDKGVEYNGEWRYLNKLPSELKKLLEVETDPDEIDAINFALSCHPKADIEMGEPFRGEQLPTTEIQKLSDLIDSNNRDTNPFPIPRAVFTENSSSLFDSLFDEEDNQNDEENQREGQEGI